MYAYFHNIIIFSRGCLILLRVLLRILQGQENIKVVIDLLPRQHQRQAVDLCRLFMSIDILVPEGSYFLHTIQHLLELVP
jgi:gamma-glutamyl phosphate reductase